MVVSVCLNVVEGYSQHYLRVNAMRICFEYVTDDSAAFLSSFCCSLALQLTKEEQTIAPLLIFVFFCFCADLAEEFATTMRATTVVRQGY